MHSVVQRHYDTVAAPARDVSKLLPLRDYHNEVKRYLISTVEPAPRVVVDFACGKGGDLPKFDRLRATRYVGVDISVSSLVEAQRRARSMRVLKETQWVHGSIDSPDLLHSSKLRDLVGSVDCVNCQFALHYCFKDRASVARTLQNAAALLKPGAHFLVTTVDADVLVKRLRESGGSGKFGNGVYTVEFVDTPSNTDPFSGTMYRFTLTDGERQVVDACPEFLVHAPTLTTIAAEHGFGLERTFKFPESVAPPGTLTSDQADASWIYRAFVFVKRSCAA